MAPSSPWRLHLRVLLGAASPLSRTQHGQELYVHSGSGSRVAATVAKPELAGGGGLDAEPHMALALPPTAPSGRRSQGPLGVTLPG